MLDRFAKDKEVAMEIRPGELLRLPFAAARTARDLGELALERMFDSRRLALRLMHEADQEKLRQNELEKQLTEIAQRFETRQPDEQFIDLDALEAGDLPGVPADHVTNERSEK
jgi:hypothetical protein